MVPPGDYVCVVQHSVANQTADAIQLACAAASVDLFMTNDARLQ